ncbi:DUF1579 domain-containing protein [Flavobacterium sp.]|uniref:DUF1579 domain-containing protein n=1 Tax=Flavobacterium sp. TaxID=239 RepID=UPI003D27CDF7
MKKLILSVLVVSMSIISCKKVEIKTEIEETPEAKTEAAEIVLDSAAMAKAWADYATPSKAHEMLAKDTGVWDADMTFWMPDNPEAQKAKSKAEYKMILGGLYQEGKYSGDIFGMQFEGKGLMAFDNETEEYISTWVDNMGTGIMVTRGKYDEASKSIILFGDQVVPGTGKSKKVKEVITYMDENNQKMEMFDILEDEKEIKTMEIVSKRVK